MSRRLPVISAISDRLYPTRLSQQAAFKNEHDVCRHCLAGSCCSSEDPIALTPFDVLRLSAFLDVSPAEFLLTFTQDRFADPPEEESRHHAWIERPESSVVTFLRRRAEFATSPCIFLKYIREEDGTPRRVCCAHAARPLACREYYYDTCKARVTNELATHQAAGFEAIRDGEITADQADSVCKSLEPVDVSASLARKWQYAFWSEMRRAADVERTNEEGANGYPISSYQDPIDEKLNRLLSRRHLRFEEKYGPVPNGEQLDPYTAGLSYRSSPDYDRIFRIVHSAPAHGLFRNQDYPHYVGLHTLMAVALPPGDTRLRTTPPGHACSSAAALGLNFLFNLATRATAMARVVELESDSAFGWALLDALLSFDRALRQQLVGIPYLRPVTVRAASAVADTLREYGATLVARRATSQRWIELYASVARFDNNAAPPRLRHEVKAIRMEAARRWRALSCDDREHWLRPPTTSASMRWLVGRVARLRATDALEAGDRGFESSLEVLHAVARSSSKAAPTSLFEAMDALVRAGPPLRRGLRRRVAALALHWSFEVERSGLWSPQFMLRWPALCGELGMVSPSTPGVNRSVDYIISSQEADGSWSTDLGADEADAIGSQGDYVLQALTATAVAVQGLSAMIEHHRAAARR